MKELAIDIGSEVRSHNRFLEGMDEEKQKRDAQKRKEAEEAQTLEFLRQNHPESYQEYLKNNHPHASGDGGGGGAGAGAGARGGGGAREGGGGGGASSTWGGSHHRQLNRPPAHGRLQNNHRSKSKRSTEVITIDDSDES